VASWGCGRNWSKCSTGRSQRPDLTGLRVFVIWTIRPPTGPELIIRHTETHRERALTHPPRLVVLDWVSTLSPSRFLAVSGSARLRPLPTRLAAPLWQGPPPAYHSSATASAR